MAYCFFDWSGQLAFAALRTRRHIADSCFPLNRSVQIRNLPYSSFLLKSIVIVRVGPQGMRLDLHKEYICSKSDFSKAACSGNFKEADGVIKLPEQDPGIFKHFVHWLYSGRLVCHDISNLALFRDAPFASLVSLYILADQLQTRGLKDPIVNMMIGVYADSANRHLFWARLEDPDRPNRLRGPAAGIKLAWELLP